MRLESRLLQINKFVYNSNLKYIYIAESEFI